MTVFLCEDGFNGILCGVYDAYASGLDLSECRLELESEYEPVLFAVYRSAKKEEWKAERVAAKIRSRMSAEVYLCLYRASLHKSPDRADWIFRLIRLGLRYGKGVMKRLQEPEVYEVFQMDRCVAREAHALVEFIRFERLGTGLYFGTVGPENDVLELAAVHFSDRFPDMDWLLYDEKRGKAAAHSRKGFWTLREKVGKEEIAPFLGQGGRDEYVKLWKTFFQSIAIKERENPACQQNMLPLRYRKYMTEFQ